jgi:hypothetical protein
MAQTGKWILGAAAIALTLGAVQLASGQDLAGRLQASQANQADAASQLSTINRSAKADRARAAAPTRQSRTISLNLQGLSDTSVLVRVPSAASVRGASNPASSGGGATAVACEPMVSVLTEVAKRLEPGRCVT